MELILLAIYFFFVWLIFIKFKWLPWNIVSQVIVITIPIIALTALILLLNIVCPSSHDVRVINYVVQVVPRVTGRVIEVPVQPNAPIKKGDVLFKLDPVPFEIQVRAAESNLANLKAKLISAEASAQSLDEQLKAATANVQAMDARAALSRMRVQQFTELSRTGPARSSTWNRPRRISPTSRPNVQRSAPPRRRSSYNSAPRRPKVSRIKSPRSRLRLHRRKPRWRMPNGAWSKPSITHLPMEPS
jgi:multidrug efflux pump subunit AcrA (membrane-fusion protein)